MSVIETMAGVFDNPDGPFYECPVHGRYAGSRIVRALGEATRELAPVDWCRERERCPNCDTDARRADADWNRRRELQRRWLDAEFPSRFRNRRFANFRADTPALRKVVNTVRAWLDSDVPGLVLLGPPGAGKTHLMAAVAAELIRRNMHPRYAVTPDLFARLKSSFDRGSRESGAALLAELQQYTWLLDEIGATTRTQWETLQFSALIDERYRDGQCFVMAGNVSLKDLPAVLGERGADRLAECAIVVPVNAQSYRPKAVSDEGLNCADDFDPGEEPNTPICVCGVMEQVKKPRELGKLSGRCA